MPGAANTGAVHVFDVLATSSTFRQTLVPDDAETLDGFGSALDLDGNLFVAARLPSARQGAYVFGWNGASWVQEAFLEAPGLGSTDSFGQDVAIHDAGGAGPDLAVIGAPLHAGGGAACRCSRPRG
jgi:hypothetical protein